MIIKYLIVKCLITPQMRRYTTGLHCDSPICYCRFLNANFYKVVYRTLLTWDMVVNNYTCTGECASGRIFDIQSTLGNVTKFSNMVVFFLWTDLYNCMVSFFDPETGLQALPTLFFWGFLLLSDFQSTKALSFLNRSLWNFLHLSTTIFRIGLPWQIYDLGPN